MGQIFDVWGCGVGFWEIPIGSCCVVGAGPSPAKIRAWFHFFLWRMTLTEFSANMDRSSISILNTSTFLPYFLFWTLQPYCNFVHRFLHSLSTLFYHAIFIAVRLSWVFFPLQGLHSVLVIYGYQGVLLVGSTLSSTSYWYGDPQAWPHNNGCHALSLKCLAWVGIRGVPFSGTTAP